LDPAAPRRLRPRIALLCDDAHSVRASRLAHEETEPSARASYEAQSRNLRARQRALYAEADAVLYLTELDMEAEEELRRGPLPPLLPRIVVAANGARMGHALVEPTAAALSVGLLRMGMGRNSILGAEAAAEQRRRQQRRQRRHRQRHSDDHRMWVGFVGDGHTPTNALGVQRFLREAWPRLRARWPHVRLRIVGRVPSGHRAGRREGAGGKNAPCAGAPGRCGWAFATPCASSPSACGVDTLGYLSDESLVEESRHWRLMLVPIFATTGVNTKLLLGLQLGLPVVSTAAAAAPFLPSAAGGKTLASSPRVPALGDEDEGGDNFGGVSALAADPAIAVATTPLALASLTAHLLSNRTAADRLAAAGRARLAALTRSHAAALDAEALLAWASPTPPAAGTVDTVAGIDPKMGTAPAAAPPPASARAVIVVSTCGLTQLWPEGELAIRAVWRTLCAEEGFQCPAIDAHEASHSLRKVSGGDDAGTAASTRTGTGARGARAETGGSSAPPPPPRWVVFDDGRCQLRGVDEAIIRNATATPASLVRYVHFGWDPSAAQTLYHARGGLLRHVAASERVAARLNGHGSGTPRAAEGGGVAVRVNRMASASGFDDAWRQALSVALEAGDASGNRGASARELQGNRAGTGGGGAKVEPEEVESLLRRAAMPARKAFVAALKSHRQRPRWPLRVV
jgi:hypothetical protein